MSSGKGQPFYLGLNVLEVLKPCAQVLQPKIVNLCSILLFKPLQWRHNGHDGAWNHQSHDCLLKDLFRRRLKKKSKFHVTGLCEGNSPVTGEFPAQRASNTEKFSFDDVIMKPLKLFWIPSDGG